MMTKIIPCPADIIFDHGSCEHHHGNLRLISMLKENTDLLFCSSEFEELYLIQSILGQLKNSSPNSRFLSWDQKCYIWKELVPTEIFANIRNMISIRPVILPIILPRQDKFVTVNDDVLPQNLSKAHVGATFSHNHESNASDGNSFFNASVLTKKKVGENIPVIPDWDDITECKSQSVYDENCMKNIQRLNGSSIFLKENKKAHTSKRSKRDGLKREDKRLTLMKTAENYNLTRRRKIRNLASIMEKIDSTKVFPNHARGFSASHNEGRVQVYDAEIKKSISFEDESCENYFHAKNIFSECEQQESLASILEKSDSTKVFPNHKRGFPAEERVQVYDTEIKKLTDFEDVSYVSYEGYLDALCFYFSECEQQESLASIMEKNDSTKVFPNHAWGCDNKGKVQVYDTEIKKLTNFEDDSYEDYFDAKTSFSECKQQESDSMAKQEKTKTEMEAITKFMIELRKEQVKESSLNKSKTKKMSQEQKVYSLSTESEREGTLHKGKEDIRYFSFDEISLLSMDFDDNSCSLTKKNRISQKQKTNSQNSMQQKERLLEFRVTKTESQKHFQKTFSPQEMSRQNKNSSGKPGLVGTVSTRSGCSKDNKLKDILKELNEFKDMLKSPNCSDLKKTLAAIAIKDLGDMAVSMQDRFY